MLRAAVLALTALALVPAGAATSGSPVSSAIFYYPWYGTPAHDGRYLHWAQHGATPPRRIASSYYPARGPYSSGDGRVVRAQMRDIARAGVGEVIVSWWGRRSVEDARLPLVVRAARAAGLRVAAHLEPYPERTAASVAADARYLRRFRITELYVYDPGTIPASEWRPRLERLHGFRVLAQTPLTRFAAAAGFDGVYTYDVLVWGGDDFSRICGQAHRLGLFCSPSVGPGFDARRATGERRLKPRRNGRTYDAMWRAALRARADLVTITSYNEWHEGTQIEPARAQPGYASYAGAWGRRGEAAERAYLARTAYWTARLRGQ
jgi:glycoprotein endo-alpha-1,2-mannosidase